MADLRYALFDAALGRCAIVWSDAGVAAVQLQEASVTKSRERIRSRFPLASETAPSPAIRRVTLQLSALLEGDATDLSGIALDLSQVSAFYQRVYTVTRRVPPGRTTTYGDIAERLGSSGAARAVGQALGRNPFALIVPCHRVLTANGKLGGFSAYGGVAVKERLLAIEGAWVR
jgi:methylated-DNA-[protein]-cysteine S-methyltransferase